MRIKLQPATPDDVADLIELHTAVVERLKVDFGEGYWVTKATEKGTLFAMRRSKVHIARYRQQLIAQVGLSTRKPWAIDTKYFTPCQRPLYLNSMAVLPSLQRDGVGRQCIYEAIKIAKRWPADSIRLDAWEEAVAPASSTASAFQRSRPRNLSHCTPDLLRNVVLAVCAQGFKSERQVTTE